MVRGVLAAALAAVFLSACNSEYSDALANAKIHVCQLDKINKQLAGKPGDKALEAQAREMEDFLKIDREMSGDPGKLQAEIAAHLQAGCR